MWQTKRSGEIGFQAFKAICSIFYGLASEYYPSFVAFQNENAKPLKSYEMQFDEMQIESGSISPSR